MGKREERRREREHLNKGVEKDLVDHWSLSMRFARCEISARLITVSKIPLDLGVTSLQMCFQSRWSTNLLYRVQTIVSGALSQLLTDHYHI